MFCLDKRQKHPLDKLFVTTLYAILLLFTGSFDQFTIVVPDSQLGWLWLSRVAKQ